MGHALYSLFMACCMFALTVAGLIFALSMWRKSNSLCDECRNELDK